MTKSKNTLDITIDGLGYTLKYGQLANEKMFDIFNGGEVDYENPFRLTRLLLLIGLDNSLNAEVSPSFSEEVVIELIEKMEDEEFQKAKDFAFEAMGFMLEETQEDGKKINPITPEKPEPTSTQKS